MRGEKKGLGAMNMPIDRMSEERGKLKIAIKSFNREGGQSFSGKVLKRGEGE